MILLPEISLPRDFVDLLKLNMNYTIDALGNIKGLVLNRPNLKLLVENSFLDIDSKRRVDIILNSLGWFGFRDRLASLYIYRYENDAFPSSSNLSLVSSLEEFEKKFREYSVEGFSRTYLLAFYLRAARCLKKNENRIVGDFNFFLPPSLEKYLAASKTKSLKIDWVILLLTHFDYFLGEETVLKILRNNKTPYQKLYTAINPGQQKILTSNLLSYGYSVDEMDVLIPNLV